MLVGDALSSFSNHSAYVSIFRIYHRLDEVFAAEILDAFIDSDKTALIFLKRAIRIIASR